jgi:hypothetical protein
MKTGLWAVIVLVTGIVGFLVGYGVSGYTGVRKLAEAQASEAARPATAPAAAQRPAATPGYGGAEKPAAAAGYGAPEKAAPKPPVKPAAAGY